MKTISFINLKGGVGKTTISVNFAYTVSQLFTDAKILFIDNDKQGNATDWLSRHDGQEYGSITHLLMGDVTADNIQAVIQPTVYDNIDLIAGDMGLIEAHAKLIKTEGVNQATIIRDALKNVASNYDLCIIDNPPDINLSVFNTLAITDSVVIVTTPEQDSLDGMQLMLQQIAAVRSYNECLTLKGILFNQFIVSPESYALLNKLKEESIPMFTTRLRYANQKTKYAMIDARKQHKTLVELAPSRHLSRDIVKFTKEFFEVRD